MQPHEEVLRCIMYCGVESVDLRKAQNIGAKLERHGEICAEEYTPS